LLLKNQSVSNDGQMVKNITRRGFLSYLLISTAAAGFMPKYAFSFTPSNKNQGNNWLSFSLQDGMGPSMSESSLVKNYYPLHEETVLQTNRIRRSDYRNTLSLLKQVLESQGVRWKKSNKIVWTYQHYGVCDPSIHSERLLSYSISAQDYLYSHISGLININLDWSLLINHRARALEDTHGYRGLIGRHTYLVYRVNAVDEEGEQILPGLVNIMPVERAINYIVDDNDHNPIGSTIFLIHGSTSLISPFTELIHLSTHQPTLQLTSEMTALPEGDDARMTGREYGESITEAAGSLLALRFLQKYGREDKNDVIRMIAQNISNQYPMVQSVMSYMQQHSVQRVLSDYSENPGKVVGKIENI
jgi:hypothetical protein